MLFQKEKCQIKKLHFKLLVRQIEKRLTQNSKHKCGNFNFEKQSVTYVSLVRLKKQQPLCYRRFQLGTENTENNNVHREQNSSDL